MIKLKDEREDLKSWASHQIQQLMSDEAHRLNLTFGSSDCRVHRANDITACFKKQNLMQILKICGTSCSENLTECPVGRRS